MGITSGNDLLRGCTIFLRVQDGDNASQQDASYAVLTMGYIEGVKRGCDMMQTAHGFKLPYAIPPDVDAGQIVRVIDKWLEDHPEKLHLPAEALILEALVQAFPPNPSK